MVTKGMLTRLIGFFLVLAVIFLFFHFCATEVKGQTPPMNPLTYTWDVDPLGVYLNTLDTYRVLQQHHAEIDSSKAEEDTLQLEVDTLRDRVDLLETSRDTVFYAYDATGGQTITTTSVDFITLDTERRKDAIYVHVDDAAAVECTSSGWYKISYSVSVVTADDSYTVAVASYLYKYAGSWVIVGGASCFGYSDASALGFASMSKTVIDTLTSGDSLAIKVQNGSVSANITTGANTVNLVIEKLH